MLSEHVAHFYKLSCIFHAKIHLMSDVQPFNLFRTMSTQVQSRLECDCNRYDVQSDCQLE